MKRCSLFFLVQLFILFLVPTQTYAATVTQEIVGYYDYAEDSEGHTYHTYQHKTGYATQIVDLRNVATLNVNFYCVAYAGGAHNANVIYNSVVARIRNSSGTVLSTSAPASMPGQLIGQTSEPQTQNSGNKTLLLTVPASARQANMCVDVYVDANIYCGSVTIYHTSDTVAQSAHTHSYTLTTDNSKIRSNATTSDAATYWNKCSCGTFATSGSDYHSVGYPLVSYSSGLSSSKNYDYGKSLILTAIFNNAKSYQWYKNGTVISGETSNTLNLGVQNTLALNGNKYKCIATGYNGNTGMNSGTTAISTECTVIANTTSFKPSISASSLTALNF